MSELTQNLIPPSVLRLESNDTFNMDVDERSSFSETVGANLGISYGSAMFEFDNFAKHGVDILEPGGDNESVFNPLQSDDEEIIAALNNPNNLDIKHDLIYARNKEHLLGMIDQKQKRIEQHNIIEKSSWGTFLLALVADPINGATIFLPVLRSKTVWDAITKSAVMTGGIVAPLEMTRVYADPLVKPIEGVTTTGASMLFSSVLSGTGRGLTNYFTGVARNQIASDVIENMIHIGQFADDPIYRDSAGALHGKIIASKSIRSDGTPFTQYSVRRDGKIEKINYSDIPLVQTGKLNSFDTSGSGKLLDTWAYKAITTPFKRPIMNKNVPDEIKGIIHDLASDMGMKFNKNKLGLASNFSVHIKSNTDHGKWVRAYDDVLEIYKEDTGKALNSFMDYRLRGGKRFDDWMKNVNRRMVYRDFNGATEGEMKAVRIFEKFWKDWEKLLIRVNMIGNRRGSLNEITRKEARIEQLKNEPAIKGDLDYNKETIKRLQSEVNELKDDLKSNPDSALPQNELSYLPRYFNHDMILAKREKFTNIIAEWYAKNPYIYEKGKQVLLKNDPASVMARAKETVSKILGETDGTFEQSFAGYSSKHTRHRNLNIPNKDVWEFIEQNPITVMKNYTTRVSPEYHFRDTFGGRSLNEMQEYIYNTVYKSSNLKTAQSVVRDFTALYERIVGNVVKNPSAMNQRIRQVLSDLAGLTYLGSAGFATLTDYAAILMQREMGAFFKLGFSVLDSQKPFLNAKEGRYSGQVIDILMNMEGLRLVDDLSNRTIDRGLYSKVMGKAKTLFYSTNLLGPATNLAKRMEAMFRAHQIVEDAIGISSGAINSKTAKGQQTIEMMAKMGFGLKEINEIAKKAPWQRENNKSIILANSDEWIDAGVSRETLDKFRYSMNAGIFNTVIMSSPADKPILMDGVYYVPWRVAKFVPGMKQDKAVRGYSRIENGLFSLPFAFMSYSFGAANKITASMAQNTLKNKAMGTVAAMGLAYMGLQLRYRNRPYILENMSNADKIARTFDYSGLAAIYSDMFYRGLSIGANLGYFENSPVNPKFISRDESERPMDAALEIAGAPPSLAVEYARGLVDLYNGEVNEGVQRFQRNFPFAKIWWLESYMKDLGKVIGRW